MSKRYQYGIMACALFVAASCSMDTAEDVAQRAWALTPATWTDVVNVTAVGNNLTKPVTGGTNNFDGGAVSNEFIAAGADGAVEFTTAENTRGKLAGLSVGNAGEGYADIDFAFNLTTTGLVRVYEGGVLKDTVGTYVAGTKFRIVSLGGVVTYQIDGVDVYTSLNSPTGDLLFDTSLGSRGGTIQNVNFGSAFWQNDVAVDITGTSIQKPNTITTGWGNSGASTFGSISGDGYAEFTSAEANRGKAAGLSHTDADQNWDTIDYAFNLSTGGLVRIYESGVFVTNAGTYNPGDVFRVEAVGGVVNYYINGGAPVYTSTMSPTFPLVFDAALNTRLATIQNVVITEAPGPWQNVVGALPSGGSLWKSATTGWGNSGASSVATLAADGYAEFTTAEATTGKMAGLSYADANQGYSEIAYALNFSTTGLLRIYESGAFITNAGTYAAGDLFRIVASGGSVKYFRNDVLLYTSATAPTSPMLFDTSLNTMGATINSMVLVDLPACMPVAETCDGLDNDCDSYVDNGFDLTSDVNNCGTCGYICTLPNSTELCASSTCGIASCDTDFWDINVDPADGCEYACTFVGAEVCEGSVDENCDGFIDEGCP